MIKIKEKDMRKFNALKYLLAVSIVVGAVFTAVSCDSKKDEEEGHTHTFGDWVETEATCTEKGTMTRVCKECQQSEDRVTSEALGHDITNHAEKAPTCTEDGNQAYVTCSRCDYTTYSKIDALGHNVQKYSAKSPTCTENGHEAFEECTRCDYTTFTVITAPGHSIVEVDAKAPTCTEDGYGAYEYCTKCTHNTCETIPAQHNFEEGVCTECGEEACEVHNFGDWYGDTATCEHAGKEYQKCDNCGFVVSRDTAIKAHAIVNHAEKPATCTEPGYEAYETCEKCSYTTYKAIPAGHKFEGGECTVCGTSACEKHVYGDPYGNTATCQAGGVEYVECLACGRVETRATEKTSHKYENKVCIWCGAKDYTLPPQPLGAKKDD